MSDRERATQLMMASLDGELDDAGRRELEAMLKNDETLAAELAKLEQVKEVTEMMTLKKVPEEVWETYWTGVYNRVERGIGWILVSIGSLVLISWGTWAFIEEMFKDADIPTAIKISVVAVIVGFAVLTVSVIREKLKVRKHDPFKEVQR